MGADGNILIDPVAMSDADSEHLAALGGAKSIVLTNADHEREAAVLQEQTGADVIVHEADADALSITPVRTVQDREAVVPGLHAIHLSHGKSPGEIALYFPDKQMVLFGIWW